MDAVGIEPATDRFWHTFGMARFGGFKLRSWSLVFGINVWLCTLLFAAMAAAQAQPGQDEPITTLHAYTNLIQIPVLVLGPNLERLKIPITSDRFAVRIDSGPLFPATHVRREGDDPISLAILLDLTGPVDMLLPKLDDVIADLAPRSLRPQDRVSIYALDCSLKRSLDNVPATYSNLKGAVSALLQARDIRREDKDTANCTRPVHLWDSLAEMAKELSRRPGRHVILAVTDGQDLGSNHKWSELTIFAQAMGVSIFGLKYAQSGSVPPRSEPSENAFSSVCELSGGIVATTDEPFLSQRVKRIAKMVRQRYIVEFPRPARSTAGQHSIQVVIAEGNDYVVRPAGLAVPLPDASVQADPTTITSGPSVTPEMGTRKILTKPQ